MSARALTSRITVKIANETGPPSLGWRASAYETTNPQSAPMADRRGAQRHPIAAINGTAKIAMSSTTMSTSSKDE